MFLVKPFKHFSLAYFSIKKGKTYVLVKVKETSKSSHWRSCSKLRSTLGRGRCPLFWHLVKLIWDSRDGGLSSYMLYIHHTKFETRLFSTFFLTVRGNVHTNSPTLRLSTQTVTQIKTKNKLVHVLFGNFDILTEIACCLINVHVLFLQQGKNGIVWLFFMWLKGQRIWPNVSMSDTVEYG